MNKHHYRFINKEDRLVAWQFAREDYNLWRTTDDAKSFIKNKINKQAGLCFICLEQLGETIHVDHIFPLYLGGTNFKGNLCVTHPRCNMLKGADVTMTYKQACSRRRLLNNVTKGLRVYRTLKKKPTYQPTKKEQRAMNAATRYIDVELYLYNTSEREVVNVV